MSRYFFKLHKCDGSISDDEQGREFDDPGKIHAAAVEMARSIMAAEIRGGNLCLSCWIVVSDDRKHNMLTLHFGEAVQMTDHPGCVGGSAA